MRRAKKETQSVTSKSKPWLDIDSPSWTSRSACDVGSVAVPESVTLEVGRMCMLCESLPHQVREDLELVTGTGSLPWKEDPLWPLSPRPERTGPILSWLDHFPVCVRHPVM